jgi:signal peptidase I
VRGAGQAVIRAALRFLLALGLAALALGCLWPGQDHLAVVAAGFFLLFTFLLDTWMPRPAVGAVSPAAPRSRWRTAQLALGVALAAGAGLLVRSQLGGSVRVLSTSMLPTVMPGDYLLVRKQGAAARLPRRGEVVVFSARAGEGGPPDLIKRVVGLPGEEITMEGARPVINGKPVDSCDAGAFVYFTRDKLTRGRLAVETLDGQRYLAVHEPGAPRFIRYRVRPGEVFVLGDNRGVSNDSRSWNDQRGRGVPLAAIEGRAARVLIGRHRDGRSDLGRLLEPLGTRVHLPATDVSKLQAGIDRCLASGAAGPATRS